MGSRGAFAVGEIPGQRWDLALDLLRDGGPLFLLPGDAPVGLQRYVGWPEADGLIHVSVFTSTEPSRLTAESARSDAARGLTAVRAAIAADPRLQRVLDEYGVVYEYVYDYGHGAVCIGAISDDGTVADVVAAVPGEGGCRQPNA